MPDKPSGDDFQLEEGFDAHDESGKWDEERDEINQEYKDLLDEYEERRMEEDGRDH